MDPNTNFTGTESLFKKSLLQDIVQISCKTKIITSLQDTIKTDIDEECNLLSQISIETLPEISVMMDTLKYYYDKLNVIQNDMKYINTKMASLKEKIKIKDEIKILAALEDDIEIAESFD
ncbi:unnamed protein product [Gordionus sp. m RMFG-2023]|uniref:uncharacterized protein LOC135922316 n=1 Tax=Gordionus sp. m RMFG-2023 TaxID=3053472 RepID=UPI0030E50013